MSESSGDKVTGECHSVSTNATKTRKNAQYKRIISHQTDSPRETTDSRYPETVTRKGQTPVEFHSSPPPFWLIRRRKHK